MLIVSVEKKLDLSFAHCRQKTVLCIEIEIIDQKYRKTAEILIFGRFWTLSHKMRVICAISGTNHH